VVRIRKRDVVVPAEQLPKHLRTANSRFVAIASSRELLGVEADGDGWLRLQDEVRAVLNADWDPIGVADVAPDEYDDYIGPICDMLQSEATQAEMVDFLRMVETKHMGLRPSPTHQLVAVAELLLELDACVEE